MPIYNYKQSTISTQHMLDKFKTADKLTGEASKPKLHSPSHHKNKTLSSNLLLISYLNLIYLIDMGQYLRNFLTYAKEHLRGEIF